MWKLWDLYGQNKSFSHTQYYYHNHCIHRSLMRFSLTGVLHQLQVVTCFYVLYIHKYTSAVVSSTTKYEKSSYIFQVVQSFWLVLRIHIFDDIFHISFYLFHDNKKKPQQQQRTSWRNGKRNKATHGENMKKKRLSRFSSHSAHTIYLWLLKITRSMLKFKVRKFRLPVK